MTDTTATPSDNPQATMRSIIQRIATGPELSKDITLEEARAGMHWILEGKIDPVQAGIFLIALRMKRETDEENMGVLSAVLDATTTVTAAVDEVFDIADPYDGYTRNLLPSAFLAPLLAACGVPAVTHGVEKVGPKYGITQRQVLRAAGVDVDLSVNAAADRISDADIGWSYVDQRAFCPGLHDLVPLRSLIVKRPALTTVEVLSGPIRGRNKTHLITGYVHKPYPRIYALLARHAGFDSALLVRGTEGGVIPSLKQKAKFFFYHDGGTETDIDVNPADLGIETEGRALAIPKALTEQAAGDEANETLAKATAEAGMAALAGETGAARDGLIYSASSCLWHMGKFDSIALAADTVRKVLDSGAALTRLKANHA